MKCKTDKIRDAWVAGDRIGALRIAARFFDRSANAKTFKRGMDAHNNPDFHRQLDKEPEQLVGNAPEMLVRHTCFCGALRSETIASSRRRSYLASPDGDLAEAMKIGLLVRVLNLSTVVPGKPLTNQAFESAAAEHGLANPKADYKCASASFFIFVAGVHRSHDDHGPALLGIS